MRALCRRMSSPTRCRLSLEGAQDVALMPGMTANVKIVTGQRENVLLVPLLAVQQEDTGDVVLVQDSPRSLRWTTPVEVGLNDGTYVEVLRGLNEGDRVVVEYQATSSSSELRAASVARKPALGREAGR